MPRPTLSWSGLPLRRSGISLQPSQAIWQNLPSWCKDIRMIPDTIKFIVFAGAICGAVYGTAWALAKYPPEPSEVIKPLPHEKLRVR
jgi:hypothetical protein